MSRKSTKMKMEASADDRRRVQGIKDDDGGGSRSTTGLVYWQRQRIVDFPCFQVANSNTVSSLSSLYLVFDMVFIRFFFLFAA